MMAVISGDVSVVEALNVKAGSDGVFRTKWSVYVYISVFTFEASLPHLVSVQFAHTETTLQAITLGLSLVSNARNPGILRCSSGIEVSTGPLYQTKLNKVDCAVCRRGYEGSRYPCV